MQNYGIAFDNDLTVARNAHTQLCILHSFSAYTIPIGVMFMRSFPRGGLIGTIFHAARKISRLQIGIHAASAGFFLALSVFPGLLLLLGLLRYTTLDIVAFMDAVEGFIPEALLPYTEDLIRGIYANTSGVLISLSALAALWSASRGVQGLLTGLNAIYGVRDDRSWLRTRLLSVGYTFAFLLVLAMTLAFHVFGRQLIAAFSVSPIPFLRFLSSAVDLRFFLLLGLQTALFTAMFTAFPNRPCRPVASLPGAVVASLGWLTFSHLFSLYIDYFGDHTHLYGQVYTMALCMLWLYVCLCIVFFGGAVNRFISASS